jgi:uncharacterized membrane protein
LCFLDSLPCPLLPATKWQRQFSIEILPLPSPGGTVVPEKETTRVEAFSDGVFAIAMTLLILEIKVPHPPSHDADTGKWWLLGALAELWPSFVAFVLSFGTILIMWVNHHGLFKHAHRVSHRLLFANGFLLLVVTFVPFPTAVLAEYLDKPAANAAAVFYCGTFVLVSLAYNLLLTAVVKTRASTIAEPPDHEPAPTRVHRAYHLGLIVYLAATVAAALSAFAGLAICLSLWVMWALLRYSPRHRGGES